MKWEDKGIKTPLARARGLGSAKEGTDHWMGQRITAIANIPLMLWLVYSVVSLVGASHAEFIGWLSQPLNAILMILVVISTFYHAMLGTQVVTEDYIHNEGFKIFKLIGQKLFFFGAGIACIFCVLQIAL
ncbi:MAG: succinate dehydrogenase, hydrophobic membrane anchor protein [Alphaproteobacteria bacterium]